MTQKETIAAISTAPGRSGVAVIRVSGDGAFEIARRLTAKEVTPSLIRHAVVRGDDCVILAFKSPHSYTGEDVVEFQCHGGAVAPRRVLDACLREGARLARRGEFTERAFLNGKIGYEEAEAVIDLIDAKTDRAAQSALDGFAGKSGMEIRRLYDEAVELSSEVEHSLDVDEGDLPAGFVNGISARINGLLAGLRAAMKRIREKRILRDGALVVLAGQPNSGKSSLFNALIEENRAIVSPKAGTTRDSIEAWLDIRGWPVRLVDTAGLREGADDIEAEGVRRSEGLIQKADVVLYLAPQAVRSRAKAINVHSKCDISRGEGLNVSAVTGEGLDVLREAIAAALEELSEHSGDPTTDAGEERLGAIALAACAMEAVAGADDLVLIGNALRQAASVLGKLIGAEYSSDLLERLFSRFCVGK